ncbi:hypothetical protein BD414DRAFT_309402 [Trametes punicea]|nr:hypothetical protein BD414DRAFT_309402 [Trametes punicea]
MLSRLGEPTILPLLSCASSARAGPLFRGSAPEELSSPRACLTDSSWTNSNEHARTSVLGLQPFPGVLTSINGHHSATHRPISGNLDCPLRSSRTTGSLLSKKRTSTTHGSPSQVSNMHWDNLIG